MIARPVAILCYLASLALIPWPSPAAADARADGERGIAEYRGGNLIDGMRLLESSARAGYVPAQVTLAYILDQSENNAAAFHWYSEAARSNDPAALFGLGGMFAKGEGTAPDPARAGELIRRAAELDHVPAMRAYAYALEHGSLGFAHRYGSAAEWFRRAAEHGDPDSMRRLRDAYRLGQLGLAVDEREATAWDAQMRRSQQP